MSTTPSTLPAIITEAATFIGIDFHKKYSVYHAIDAAGVDLGKGRIEHHSPQDFVTLEPVPKPVIFFDAHFTPHRRSTPWSSTELDPAI